MYVGQIPLRRIYLDVLDSIQVCSYNNFRKNLSRSEIYITQIPSLRSSFDVCSTIFGRTYAESMMGEFQNDEPRKTRFDILDSIQVYLHNSVEKNLCEICAGRIPFRRMFYEYMLEWNHVYRNSFSGWDSTSIDSRFGWVLCLDGIGYIQVNPPEFYRIEFAQHRFCWTWISFSQLLCKYTWIESGMLKLVLRKNLSESGFHIGEFQPQTTLD